MERKRRLGGGVLLGITLAIVAMVVALTFADPHYRPPVRYRADSPLEQRLNRWLRGRPGMLHSDAPKRVSDIRRTPRPTPSASGDERPPPPPERSSRP